MFDDADLLLTPMTAAGPPPARDWSRRGALRTLLGSSPWVAYSFPWNITGQPAICIPAGKDEDSMSIGVQLVAPAGEEARLLAVAALLETTHRERATDDR